MTPFETLKAVCTQACHERHACVEGYRAMLAAENVSQLMAVWRANWEDLVESKYADIINERLHELYPSLKREMNKAGIYVNECPTEAPEFVLVIVTDADSVVQVFDYAKCYVLGAANVWAWGHSQVYSEKSDDAYIILKQHTYGHISKGHVLAYDSSRLWSSVRVWVHDNVTCEAHGGEVHASGYRKIEASGDTKVYSPSIRNITLHGNARIIE